MERRETRFSYLPQIKKLPSGALDWTVTRTQSSGPGCVRSPAGLSVLSTLRRMSRPPPKVLTSLPWGGARLGCFLHAQAP